MGRFQFSLRLLLISITLVCAAMAAYRVEHSWGGRLAIHGLTWFFATASILGAMQTTGRLKAFWIGTAFVLSITAVSTFEQVWSTLVFHTSDPYLHRESVDWQLWCIALANGLLCLLVYCMFWAGEPSENRNSK